LGCAGLLGCEAERNTDLSLPEGSPARTVRPSDVALPDGYTIEAVATGLTFPTGATTDEQGRVYVAEAGYSYGEVWGQPKLLRIESDGSTSIVATGGHPPWNGVDYAQGAFFIAEGGEAGGGRILRMELRSGQPQTMVLVDNLPSFGDHHTNGPVVGPDGYVYFGQGTATNSGVVGLDNLRMGWLQRHPEFHDIPGWDITLAGVNISTPDLLDPLEHEPVVTGAFVPFGEPTSKGQTIKGHVPCTGAIMRVPISGGQVELVAWGLRNPFGVAFSLSGQLYATDSGCEPRGGRPFAAAPDVLWKVQQGAWYGWPDYQAGERPGPAGAPLPLLAHDPSTPPHPVAKLGLHGVSMGADFSRTNAFGFAGDAFVAQFGDLTPVVGLALSSSGFRVIRVGLGTGEAHDFAVNRTGAFEGQSAPASRLGSGGLERPIAVRFSRDGSSLYIVDFGVMNATKDGAEPVPGTGVVWRVRKTSSPRAP
jgi:glucose/arabinose dehydrogenase